MKLSDIRQILTERNLQLTKSLGQNFLHDQNQIRRIADAAELNSADHVLEIGPGLGPLTDLLVQRAGKVLAVEMDHRLVEFLREKFASTPNFELVHGDGLHYVKEHRDWENWKLVSNLPYSVASPILVELAEAQTPPQRLVATIQLEVAQRINAPTDSEHYGILSLLMQLRYEAVDLFKIRSGCFFPEPGVDSACITLVRRSKPLLPTEKQATFKKLVKAGFSQRRKMMMKLLKPFWPQEKLTPIFEELQLSPQIRAEKVSLEQFVRFTELLG